MDRDLVVRARGGDRDAFARLAAAAITRLDASRPHDHRATPSGRRTPSRRRSTRAWRDLPSLRDPDRFDAWLRRLLVHACIDELRHARRRVIEVELTDLDHPRVGDSSLALADRDALEHAFRRLDPVQRSLIVMHYYLDLPLAEVAEALGAARGDREVAALPGPRDAPRRPRGGCAGRRRDRGRAAGMTARRDADRLIATWLDRDRSRGSRRLPRRDARRARRASASGRPGRAPGGGSPCR